MDIYKHPTFDMACEQFDLVADGALGDEQFVRGARKAPVAGGSFKCAHSIQWRQSSG